MGTSRALLAAMGIMALGAPRSARADARPTVAVLYFDYEGKSDDMRLLRKGLAQMLITDLAALPQLRVVERERLQAVLDELDLGQTRRVDPATANKVGKLLGARYLVVGSFFDLLGQLRVDARIVETETGKVVRSIGAAKKPDEFIEVEQAIAKDLCATFSGLAGSAPPSGSGAVRPAPRPPKKLEVKTALRYARALDAIDRKDPEAAKVEMQAVLKEQPDFILASMDLAALAR